jgi:flavin reductase (DIM6/NTAB) family NADH-FMN oxidoreductase RutF
MKEKVTVDPDKRLWHPSPLLGQIVLVTTVNADGTTNVAPKSLISVMTFRPPLLAIGCNLEHWTAQNVLRDQEFVVNVPGADLAAVVWHAHQVPHPRPVEILGLTPVPAQQVRPPLIDECKAHLECRLEQHLVYGREAILLGRILALSMDREATAAADPYAYLQLFCFLEEGTYGVVERARHVPSNS